MFKTKKELVFVILAGIFITNAVTAELIGGKIANQLGLRIPELVFANLNEAFG